MASRAEPWQRSPWQYLWGLWILRQTRRDNKRLAAARVARDMGRL